MDFDQALQADRNLQHLAAAYLLVILVALLLAFILWGIALQRPSPVQSKRDVRRPRAHHERSGQPCRQRRMHPSEIRYTQDSISRRFQNGTLLEEAVEKLVRGESHIDDFPPIRVFREKGIVYSIDNRRLFVFKSLAHRLPHITVPVHWPHWLDGSSVDARKRTNRTGGLEIQVR